MTTGIHLLDAFVMVVVLICIGVYLGYGIGHNKGYNEGWDSGCEITEKMLKHHIETNEKYSG